MVVATARFLLLVAAGILLVTGVYIVVSLAVRMARGEWLARAGPFEAQLAEHLEVAEDFFDEWSQALDENTELEQRLEERDSLIRQLLDDREVLLTELRRLGGDV